MFLGEFAHALDAKNRLIVPAKFRENLGEQFITTKGLDNCLFVYSMSEWKKIEEKIAELPMVRADARAFMRLFLAGANECTLDGQGRMLLAPSHKAYAGIDKEVNIVGVGSRIEIWSMAGWQEYCNKAESEFGSLAERMSDLGI